MRTMKNLILLLAVVLAVVGISAPLQAQSNMTVTTLSAAVSRTATTIKVTSATGFSVATFPLQNAVYVDQELMLITGVSGTTITVQRGQAQSFQSAHASGAYAIAGAMTSVSNGTTTGSGFAQNSPVGACTPANNGTLPVVNVRTNQWYNCAGDNSGNYSWALQTPLASVPTGLTRQCTPNGLQALGMLTSNGDAAAPLVIGTNKTPVSGTTYYGTIFIPQTTLLTGLSQLNGTVASTDKVVFALYSAGGTLVANSDPTGTTASGIGRFQDVAFVTPYLATGPARYWVAYQTNGNTTRFRAVDLTPGASTAGLGAYLGMLGSSFTGTAGVLASTLQTGGSPATGALPTSLIADVAPIQCAY